MSHQTSNSQHKSGSEHQHAHSKHVFEYVKGNSTYKIISPKMRTYNDDGEKVYKRITWTFEPGGKVTPRDVLENTWERMGGDKHVLFETDKNIFKQVLRIILNWTEKTKREDKENEVNKWIGPTGYERVRELLQELVRLGALDSIEDDKPEAPSQPRRSGRSHSKK